VHEEKDDKHCLQTSTFSCITSTPEYMQIKGNMTTPVLHGVHLII